MLWARAMYLLNNQSRHLCKPVLVKRTCAVVMSEFCLSDLDPTSPCPTVWLACLLAGRFKPGCKLATALRCIEPRRCACLARCAGAGPPRARAGADVGRHRRAGAGDGRRRAAREPRVAGRHAITAVSVTAVMSHMHAPHACPSHPRTLDRAILAQRLTKLLPPLPLRPQLGVEASRCGRNYSLYT